MDKEKFVSSWNNVKTKTKVISFDGGWFICNNYKISEGDIMLYLTGEKEPLYEGRLRIDYITEVL